MLSSIVIRRLIEGISQLITRRPDFFERLLEKAIGTLLGRGEAPAPVTVVGNDQFLPSDDHVELPDRKKPKPSLSAELEKVELGIIRAQYNARLFPKEYTEKNPFGLYGAEELKAAAAHKEPFARESKLWLNLAVLVKVGGKSRPLSADEIRKRGMAYKTTFLCTTAGEGATLMAGTGVDEAGQPLWNSEENGAVGNGLTAYIGSQGYAHMVKVDEAKKIYLTAKVFFGKDDEAEVAQSNVLEISVE